MTPKIDDIFVIVVIVGVFCFIAVINYVKITVFTDLVMTLILTLNEWRRSCILSNQFLSRVVLIS